MAVENTSDFSGPFAPDGVATAFPFDFVALSADEVTVLRLSATSVQTILAGFTVVLEADGTGTVTFSVAPAAGDPLYIVSNPSFEQQVTFANQQSFSAVALGKALDRAAVRDIALQAALSRALLAPPTDALGVLPPAATRAGKFLAFDASGLGIPASGTGADVGMRTDLAAATGAALVGTTGPGTVQGDITARPTSAVLAASGGSALIGHTNGATGARTISAQVKMDYHLDAREFTGTWDGTALDTTGLQNAVNEAGVRNATLHVPKGVKSNAITVSAPCKIQGEGGKSTIVSDAGSYTQFNISSSDVSITDLTIQAAAKTGGLDFNIACGTGTIDRIALKNILSFDSYGFLADSGSGAGCCITQNFEEIQARRLRGPGVAIMRLFAHGFWRRMTMEFIGVSSSNFTAFMVDGAGLTSPGGLTMDDCNAAGTAGVFTNTSQIGFDLKNFSDIKLNARSDSMGGDGFRYTNVNVVTAKSALSGLCDGHQHVFTGVTNSIFDQMTARGRNGLSGTASKDGLRFVSGNSGLTITNALSRDNTGDGASKLAAQGGPVGISWLDALSNTGLAVRSVGNSAFYVGNGQFLGNTAGNYNIAGTSDFLAAQLNSGAVVRVGPGPLSA